MIAPNLCTWIEKRNYVACFWINTCLEILLKAVTGTTRKAEITFNGETVRYLWDYVINFH